MGFFMLENISDYYDRNNRLKVRLSTTLDENIEVINTIFADCQDVVKKQFVIERNNVSFKIYIMYIDGLTNNETVEETIIKPISYEWHDSYMGDIWQEILFCEAQTVDITEVDDFDTAVLGVLKGDTAIFVDGYAKAMVVSTKRYPLRSIGNQDSEATLRGPRDNFNEGIRQSTALIRRRIRDPKLKVYQGTIGQRSRTDYAIMYLSDIAKPELVEEVKRRIDKYDIDAIFDSGMAEHLMEDNWYKLFPSFQATSRPDKVASGIVEGRVAVVIDNSPEVILAPVTFNMMLQASDDYYNGWAVGTFARILRYVAALIAIALPGFYIASTVFHDEIIPDKLLYAIASARSMVTFSITLEILIMELFFELLREAGIRLPGPLGNTIGIVGGLIVGQAAVDAGIVSTIVVILVALTAISSFAIPNEVFASVFRLLKFVLILTSSLMGLYGFFIGMLALAIHLSELESFGLPFMSPIVNDASHKDFVLRSPIKSMTFRPFWSNSLSRRRIRQKEDYRDEG